MWIGGGLGGWESTWRSRTEDIEVNRSALIRNALQQHLKRLRELELEEQERRGYLAQPQREEEFRIWEDTAAWPEH